MIIEVKSTSESRAPVVNDIKKLLVFLERANHHHGILLLYGLERAANLGGERTLTQDRSSLPQWRKLPVDVLGG